MQTWQEYIKHVLIPEEQLKQRIYELGEEITRDYQEKPYSSSAFCEAE